MCGLKSILLVQLSVAHCESRAGGRSGAMGAAGRREPCFPFFVRQGPKFPLFLSWKEAAEAQDGAVWLRCGALPMGGTRFPFLLPSLFSLITSTSHPRLPSPLPIPFLEATNSGGLLPPQHRRDFGSPLLLIGRAARPPGKRIIWGGAGGGEEGRSSAQLALAPRAQRVTVVGLGARQVPAACLPPPLPSTNHLVIGASCIPAGMGGCHGDGGCWLPSNSRPLAHPPWTDSGHGVLPHVAAYPHLGMCRGSCGAPGGLIGAQRGCEGVFPAAGNGFQGTVSMTAPAHPSGTLICCCWSSGVLPRPGAWRAGVSRRQEREQSHAGAGLSPKPADPMGLRDRDGCVGSWEHCVMRDECGSTQPVLVPK